MAGIGTVGLILSIVVGILLGGIVILLGVLLALSPGKVKPFLDERGRPLAGSISEKIHPNINGVPQGMFIIGKNVGNPLQAPMKGFYTFDRSAHSPMFEEPEIMRQIIQEHS